MNLELAVAGVMLGSLILYAVSAGADFGGGVWDLFASGPRAKQQREAITRALAPIWEANHVWLILVIVLLFVCFPAAFAAVTTALHVPLTLMLVGIVARGAAFSFRSAFTRTPRAERRWGYVFAVASLVTPVTLGMTVGAVVSGKIRPKPFEAWTIPDFFTSWLAPFPAALGLFTLALFAFLAAVYLTVETAGSDLQEDFRRRALVSGLACGALAWACLFLSHEGAPLVKEGLLERRGALLFQGVTGLAAVAALLALWFRRYPAARLFAAAQVALVVLGWGLSQYPYILPPDLTIAGAAAPRSVLRPVLVALAAGAVLLFPALGYLYLVFKRTPKA